MYNNLNPYVVGFLILISFLFIILNTTHKATALGIIGFTLLFFIGLQVLTANLEYPNGYNVVMSNESSVSSSYISTPIYSTWNDGLSHTLGFIITIAGALGFALTLFTLNEKRGV